MSNRLVDERTAGPLRCAAPDIAACAAFHKESRMKFANATNTDREIRGSGVEGPAVPLGFTYCDECAGQL
jgi:hypothetical protein